MGELKNTARKKSKRTPIQNKVIATLRDIGKGSKATFTPGVTVGKVWRAFGATDYAQDRSGRYRVQQAVRRLAARGLVRIEGVGLERIIELTKTGEAYANKLFLLDELQIEKPRSWDGKWRILIFDVWENRRGARQRLREMLKKIGFVRLQDSVWVYPYDCEDLVAFIRIELRLGGKSVLYIIADEVEQDEVLRRRFKLDK